MVKNEKATMGNPEHVKWLLEGVESWNKRRENEEFRPDFASVDFTNIWENRGDNSSGANIPSLKGINLSGANLKDAYLGSMRFLALNKCHTVDLTTADFRYSDLTGAEFLNVDLTGADFSDAILNDATFSRSDLVGACFSWAQLSGARFSNCNLEHSKLYKSRLNGAEFFASRPWKSKLYCNSNSDDAPPESFSEKTIASVEDLLSGCREFRATHKDDIVLYFRGESGQWDLKPSVMRSASLRSAESKMLSDLMTRQPEAYSGLGSALAQWVLAQHHGLPTRLLDITRNPLVALFNACTFTCKDRRHKDEDARLRCSNKRHRGEDGRIHVFAVPRRRIKSFDSDAVSVVANLAKLPRDEQNLLLGKSKVDVADDDFPADAEILANGSNLFARAKHHLYYSIRRERPSFVERIDIRDLYRVFVVEPQRMFERIRAQSGAFLVSAFQERFESQEINWAKDGVPYLHYVLSVPYKQKMTLLDDLRLLNVTRETMFPSVDETASTIVQQYLRHPNQSSP